MKCPDCSREIKNNLKRCPHCGARLTVGKVKSAWFRLPLMILGWIAAIAVLSLGVYKLYFVIDSYRVNKLYTRGALAPTISEMTMDDGNRGHVITYYGNDGDRLFFEDLDKTLEISGGVARLEIADNYWFGAQVNEMDYAEISLQAILVYESGDKRRLPAYEFKIPAPESPIKVISPAQDDISINTSIYKLEVQVVPGSTVTVNGKDVTDVVSRAGVLEVSLNIYPIGDNVITLIVNTPGSREARKDVTIYRQSMEIALEVDANIPTKSTSGVATITGKCDLGGTVSVDTPIVDGSLTQDAETGKFSFIAKLSEIGDNTVRFRATMDGKADSIISLTVYYLPPLNDYAKLAWAMDYVEVRRMYDEWQGRVFKCSGRVIDTMEYEGLPCIVLDVSTEGEAQPLVMINYSKVDSPIIGGKYTAYADLNGRTMYNGHYCPLLSARYIYDEN